MSTHALAAGHHPSPNSLHLGALQIGANGQRARVELLEFSDGSIKIELTYVTDNQSPNARVLGDAAGHAR